MAFSKQYATLPLKTLSDRVSALSELCDPDYRCVTPQVFDDVQFVARDFDDEASEVSGSQVVLRIRGVEHLFTDWSRPQLLSHLGTREKWFKAVSAAQQAFELNERRVVLHKHRLRIMRTYTEGVSLFRGIVSDHYAEIPDTLIMEAVLAAQPDGQYLPQLSGKTDKAFYCYMTADAKVGTSKYQATPGAVFRNSEVGFTSLWITPFLLIRNVPIVVRQHVLLRRSHRGQLAELRQDFDEALDKLSKVWGPLNQRLLALPTVSFNDEETALGHMRTTLKTMRITSGVIESCAAAYSAAKHQHHTAATVFDAVLQVAEAPDRDDAYEKGELAGLFLFRVI
jgi:hypothetical protein